MFIGHFAVGFGAKKFAPGLSLGLLFIAAQFVDLLWPTLLLLNVEHVEISPGITEATPLDFTHYPVSHSLLMVLFWSLLFAGIFRLFRKNKKYAWILAFCVLSHWLLDLLVHRPDLPLYPGNSSHVGLGLWNYPIVTAILEGGLFITGIAMYISKTQAINGVGKYGLFTLIGLLIISYVMNFIGPPPPNVAAIAWVGHSQWLFVLLAFWVDHNRRVIRKEY